MSLTDTWPVGFTRGAVNPSQGSCSGSPSFTCSLGIPKVPPAKPSARLSVNPFPDVWRGAVRVWPDRTLRASMFGDTYFWFLGALLQAALLPFGQDVLHFSEDAATQLYAALAIGIAAGSLSAGRLSGHHIELGLVPVGSIGLGVFSLGLAGSSTYAGAAIALGLLGFSGGFFAVPLNALLADLSRLTRTRIVILDACRDNPFADGIARTEGTRSLGTTKGLARVYAGVGSFIVYSTQPGNVALDGSGRNSPFTKALLDHMALAGADVHAVMRRVRADVQQHTREQQIPWENSSLIDEVAFASGGPSPT